jgi:hypothetical protein
VVGTIQYPVGTVKVLGNVDGKVSVGVHEVYLV